MSANLSTLFGQLPEAAVQASPRAPLAADAGRVERAWHVLHDVLDPEVPALSVVDLGIVRAVREVGVGLEVDLTPTYSGCPATEVIEQSVVNALVAAQLGPVVARTVRSPAWTSDWISHEGRRKLRDYGIAPPGRCGGHDATQAPHESAPQVIHMVPRVKASQQATKPECPRCGSANTERLSAFGATACKSLHRCLSCREPFEAFKAI